jgi:osmoprotectant transport system permease protein
MDLIGEVAAWFGDPSNWTGTSGIINRTIEHVVLSFISVVAAILIAVPAGLYIGHTGRGSFITVTVANLGRSIPSYALLIIFVTWFGIGFAAAFPALVVLAIPPILIASYVGLREVDRDVVEAGRAMGMRELQLLRGVEVPIAMPVIVSGFRIAAVQVVATATLAALVGGGGLGRFIVDGFALRQQDMLVAGAILVALLALLTERALTFLERRVVSRGLRPTDTVEREVLNLPEPVESGT